MLGLADSFSDKWLAFLWEQTVPHYWLTCFSIPTEISFWINLLRKANQSSDILQHPQNRPTGDRWLKFQNTTIQTKIISTDRISKHLADIFLVLSN